MADLEFTKKYHQAVEIDPVLGQKYKKLVITKPRLVRFIC